MSIFNVHTHPTGSAYFEASRVVGEIDLHHSQPILTLTDKDSGEKLQIMEQDLATLRDFIDTYLEAHKRWQQTSAGAKPR